MKVILPLSMCRQFTVGIGFVVEVCRSNQVSTWSVGKCLADVDLGDDL